MMNLLRNLIRRAVITSGIINDSKSDLRVQQVTYLGKAADCEIIFPYGMSANVSNDSIGTMWSIQCNAEYRVALFDDPASRPRDIKQNEVVYYHPKTGSKIHFKNNGDIDITAEGSSINVIGDITMTGNFTQIGDINVDGQITATGTITGDTDVVSGSISLRTHDHDYLKMTVPDGPLVTDQTGQSN